MKIYDISRVISNEALVYPGDDQLAMTPQYEIGADSPCNITKLVNWTSHFLTHVDAPYHFDKDGETLDEVELSRWIGPALVFEMTEASITGEFINSLNLPRDINVLFKSRHSAPYFKGQFDENHVHITKSGADALVASGINLVGLDYLSVEEFGNEDYPAHRTLFAHNILILEGIDLSAVAPGQYNLIALPLKIIAGDGSPVRAILTD